jgi:hypothetical protein
MTNTFSSQNLSENYALKGASFRPLKGTGFSPYIESRFDFPALAAEGMQTTQNTLQGLKPITVFAFDVRAKARTLHSKTELLDRFQEIKICD